jgi:hypothetical protein
MSQNGQEAATRDPQVTGTSSQEEIVESPNGSRMSEWVQFYSQFRSSPFVIHFHLHTSCEQQSKNKAKKSVILAFNFDADTSPRAFLADLLPAGC